MNKIMDVPKCYYRDLDSCRKTTYTGQQIFDKFYNVGVWKENYIPKVLKGNNWTPDVTKKYICYWYSTNHADPSDFGCDILFYIEGLIENMNQKKYLYLQVAKQLLMKELDKYKLNIMMLNMIKMNL